MGTVANHVCLVPVLILNTGARAPALGFGSEGSQPVEDIENAVVSAIKMGFRHFDTASFYGTEEALARGLDRAFADGLIRREDIFVTSKIEDVDAAKASGKLMKSCTYPPKRKEDVLLPSSVRERWHALEECMRAGLLKAIGVANFSVKKLKELLEHAKVVPAINQVELHPMWQQTQLVEFCRSVGVRISSWHPLGGQLPLAVSNNAVIKDIAGKHRKTPHQIILRWIIESGFISVVQSYKPEVLLEYISVCDFKITNEDFERIGALDEQKGSPVFAV